MKNQHLSPIVILSVYIVLTFSIAGCDKHDHNHAQEGAPSAQHTEKHEHDNDKAHAQGHHHEANPETYSTGIKQLDHELQEIQELLAAGKIKETHEACEIIAEICEQLPRLAMEKNSGVPKDAIKTINQTQKQLAAKAREGHEAGEAGNIDKLKSIHGEMVVLVKTLNAHTLPTGSEHDQHNH